VRFGVLSLIAGLGLYIGAAAARVSAYKGESQPTWLTTLWLAATALVVVGLLILVNDAVRTYRQRS
jgi:hypothetical protein